MVSFVFSKDKIKIKRKLQRSSILVFRFRKISLQYGVFFLCEFKYSDNIHALEGTPVVHDLLSLSVAVVRDVPTESVGARKAK